MQANNFRLIKAAKRTIRAEVTLIAVILIITSWSVYALYKLAIAESLFEFGAPSRPKTDSQAVDTNRSANISRQPNLFGDEFSPATRHEQQVSLSPSQLAKQLVRYKQQIVKELLDKERTIDQQLGVHSTDGQEVNLGQFDAQQVGGPSSELTRWRGGHKLPSKLDGILAANKRRASQESTSSAENGRSPPSLRILSDAPSLMQLRSAATQSVENLSDTQRDFERDFEPESGDDSQAVGRNYLRSTAEKDQDKADEAQLSSEEPATTTEAAPQNVETSTEIAQEEQERRDTSADDVGGEEPATGSGSEEAEPVRDEKIAPNNNEDSNESPDEETVERAKNTAHSIDEEVDRMTQPTSGVASQRDRPFNPKSTVQFDDSPSASSAQPKKELRGEGESLQQLLGASKKASNRKVRRDDVVPNDLQVEHNLVSIANKLKETTDTTKFGKEVSAKRQDSSSGRRVKRSPVDPLAALLGEERLSKRTRAADKLTRREDDDNDDEDEAAGGRQEGSRVDNLGERQQSNRVGAKEPSLEDLVAHKQLLDMLQQSRLPPAPVAPSPPGNWVRNGSSVASNTRAQNDHQPADSLYSVDHGLLLYPTANGELAHKSKSKKGSKASKKKAKKKETVAMKKGGHKKKKHKMEAKKYVKEKKFKGAKKGKKMSKGKGGKGGKKGKKHFKDKGYKKKGFKNIYVKNEFGQKKSYFDEFRDKDFKKKWKNFDDKYNYAQMKKWQAKDVKGAKKMKDQGENFKKYDKGKWKKKYHKNEESKSSKKKKKVDEFR